MIARESLTVATDGLRLYGPPIKGVPPNARHEGHVDGRNKKKQQQQAPQGKGKQPFDPLFRLNHTCAKIRADLSRMARRRTWATTKRMWPLQNHLDIYIAYTNGYDFG